MNNSSKHICNVDYCRIHSACIFKHAEPALKADSYIVALDARECADRIACYDKENVLPTTYLKLAPVRNIFSSDRPVRSCVKCNATDKLEDYYFTRSPKILLCQDCTSKLHRYKSHHELARYFDSKTKIVSLLRCIEEIEKEGRKPELLTQIENKVIRCANIYCGTENEVTKHHLIPKPYRRTLLGPFDTVPLCRTCHDRVHRLRTNKELARHYSTRRAIVELLASDVPFRVSRLMYASNEQHQYAAMVA